MTENTEMIKLYNSVGTYTDKSINKTIDYLLQCITDLHANEEQRQYCEQKVIQFYVQVMNQMGRIPFYSEVDELVDSHNREMFELCAIQDYNRGEFDAEIDDINSEDSIDEIIDKIAFRWEEDFYYNYCRCGNVNGYAAQVLDKYRMAYYIEENDMPFDELDVSKPAEIMMSRKDDYKIVVNDCQNILVFAMAPNTISTDSDFISISNPKAAVNRINFLRLSATAS